MTLDVRFLRAKRYPHPDGIKRLAGVVMPIDAQLARHWAKVGLVELINPEPEPVVDEALESLTIAELRDLAAAKGIELHNAKKKAEILAVIRAPLDVASPTETAPADAPSTDEDDGAALTE